LDVFRFMWWGGLLLSVAGVAGTWLSIRAVARRTICRRSGRRTSAARGLEQAKAMRRVADQEFSIWVIPLSGLDVARLGKQAKSLVHDHSLCRALFGRSEAAGPPGVSWPVRTNWSLPPVDAVLCVLSWGSLADREQLGAATEALCRKAKRMAMMIVENPVDPPSDPSLVRAAVECGAAAVCSAQLRPGGEVGRWRLLL